MATPYSVVELAETGSTQDDARRVFDGAIPVLVVSARQTAGRGRTGAIWETAPRAVAASLAFASTWPEPRRTLIPLLAGLAAGRAVDGVGLKWPNDVVVGDDKAGGLLVESAGDVVVAGFGLNLWWPDAPAGMIGLHPSDPGPGAALLAAERWAAGLLELVAGGATAWPRDEYRRRCVTIGRDIVWDPDGAGRAVDVEEDGSLVVETPTGRAELRSGAVRHVRLAR